jgi:hypothetical protein
VFEAGVGFIVVDTVLVMVTKRVLFKFSSISKVYGDLIVATSK